MKVIKCVELNDMPFDKYDSNVNGLVHATGCECQFEDGHWAVEYENSNFEYA